MPKQKSFRAGTFLRVTEIHQVILVSMAPLVVPPCSLLQCVSQEFCCTLTWECNCFSTPIFPTPQVYLLVNLHTVFLVEVWMYTGLRCLTSNLT